MLVEYGGSLPQVSPNPTDLGWMGIVSQK